ncbi:LamG domain-containing protein, partial [bacterium]|nr:LamG domain-containing protein [bacterium]
QINDDQWHHLAATFARTGDLIVYQDGQLMNSTPLSSVGSVTTGQPLSIGQLWDGSSQCNYAGFMDDVRIYDHVLTQAEVQSLMFTPCTVTSAADSGEGSLRSALAEFTCSPITFADDYDIALTSPLQIERAVTIDGTDRTVTLRATDYTRVLDISADNVNLYNLTIRDGYLVDTELPDCLGAGIYCHGTASEPDNVVTLQNCSILNNYNALGYGGGIYSVLTKLHLLGCTVADNSAPYYWGGGLDQVTGCAFVIDCTFSNNTAGSAGGVMNEASELLLLNCTFSGNSASYDPSSGGALTNRDEYSRTLARNTIVADTTSGPGCGGVYVYYYSSNNIDDDGSCNAITDGFSQSSDLLLGPLGDYGGTTLTYPLLPGSVAIDAGTSSDFPTYDQRGLARFGTCDVGAFESQGFTLDKIGGDDQIASVNSAFVEPLLLNVTANNPVEPVDGGRVIFTPPAVGAGALINGSPAQISGGETSVTATANDTAGSYGVTASGSGMGSGVIFNLTNSQSVSPPPVGDGRGGTIAASFTKNSLEPDLIEVTFDATTCSADRAVIVSGSIGNFEGYVSCMQPDAGNTGTTTLDATGLNNAWFNILWSDATTAGHPGYAFNGSIYIPRTWPAADLCGKTIDDHSHVTCP